MIESILESTKRMLGIPKEDKDFDDELILHINGAFTKLDQLGIGKRETPFYITGDAETWGDYTPPNQGYADVTRFVYLTVRMLFDPPTIGTVSASFAEQLKEIEWRLSERREENKENYDTL